MPADPRYKVSNMGRVIGAYGRLITGGVNDRGYRHVQIGKGRYVYVHVLVAEAFLGAPPEGCTVDHKEEPSPGVPARTDNRACNLRWLPGSINSTGWHATRGIVWDGAYYGTDGIRRNRWTTPDDVPEDHEPLTEEEAAELHRELETAGWHG